MIHFLRFARKSLEVKIIEIFVFFSLFCDFHKTWPKIAIVKILDNKHVDFKKKEREEEKGLIS